MSQHTVDTAMARRLVGANAIRGASIIGQPGGWSVMLKLGVDEMPLVTQRTDKPRVWRSLDSCIHYLMSELHITQVDGLDGRGHTTGGVARTVREDASVRMKRAHEAAAYDQWFRLQVQESLDDPRPSVPHGQVMGDVQAVIDAARQRKAKTDD